MPLVDLVNDEANIRKVVCTGQSDGKFFLKDFNV